MKTLKYLFLLVILFSVISVCIAGELDGYVEEIQKLCNEGKTNPMVIESWKNFLKDYNISVDHIEIAIEVVGSLTEEIPKEETKEIPKEAPKTPEVIIGVIETVTVYCYDKDKNKKRVIQSVGRVFIMGKETKKVKKTFTITDYFKFYLENWDDIKET